MEVVLSMFILCITQGIRWFVFAVLVHNLTSFSYVCLLLF